MKLQYLSLLGVLGCGPKVSNLESIVPNAVYVVNQYEDCGVPGTLPFTVYVLLQAHRDPQTSYMDLKGLKSQVGVYNELRKILSKGSASVVLIEGLEVDEHIDPNGESVNRRNLEASFNACLEKNSRDWCVLENFVAYGENSSSFDFEDANFFPGLIPYYLLSSEFQKPVEDLLFVGFEEDGIRNDPKFKEIVERFFEEPEAGAEDFYREVDWKRSNHLFVNAIDWGNNVHPTIKHEDGKRDVVGVIGAGHKDSFCKIVHILNDGSTQLPSIKIVEPRETTLTEGEINLFYYWEVQKLLERVSGFNLE